MLSKGFLRERIASELIKILVLHNVGQGNDFPENMYTFTTMSSFSYNKNVNIFMIGIPLFRLIVASLKLLAKSMKLFNVNVK